MQGSRWGREQELSSGGAEHTGVLQGHCRFGGGPGAELGGHFDVREHRRVGLGNTLRQVWVLGYLK